MSEGQVPPGGQNIDIDVPQELEDGVYANFAVVHHTQHEITIDFCQLGTSPVSAGESPKAKLISRVHVAPTFAMPLLQAISTNVTRREDALKYQSEDSGEGEEK